MNLTGDVDRAQMLRAVFEGVVFSTAFHVGLLKRPIESCRRGRLSGGVARSAVWAQMMSDALQIPVETLQSGEPGARGAAMGAGIACGAFADFQDAVDHMVHVGKIYQPDPARAEIYTEKFKRYCDALDSVDALAESMGTD